MVIVDGQAPSIPKPIIAMQSPTAYLRSLAEDCTNSLDASGGRVASVTQLPVQLPDGSIATIRCSKSPKRAGQLRISVTIQQVQK